jgi:hypothetical protein
MNFITLFTKGLNWSLTNIYEKVHSQAFNLFNTRFILSFLLYLGLPIHLFLHLYFPKEIDYLTNLYDGWSESFRSDQLIKVTNNICFILSFLLYLGLPIHLLRQLYFPKKYTTWQTYTRVGPKSSGLTNLLRWHKQTNFTISQYSLPFISTHTNTDTLTSPQMALYIPRSIFHLAWLLHVRPETFGPTLVHFHDNPFVQLFDASTNSYKQNKEHMNY